MKVIVIAGGNGFLLSKVSEFLASLKNKVFVLDKNVKVDTLYQTIETNLLDKSSIEKAKNKILSSEKGIDVLINGAGINSKTNFFEIDEKEWHDILDVQLKTTFWLCQVFGKAMCDKKSGSIINITSASSGPPLSKICVYSVAKAGVKNLTMYLANEFAQYNVRVNAIKPGFFKSPYNEKIMYTKDRSDSIINHTPMRRFGEPEDLYGVVKLLCSDESLFITGTEIPVDGGFSCYQI